jgi:hypothetical protein
LYKEDVLYQGDTRDLPEYQSHTDIPTYIQQTTIVPETVRRSRMKAFWDVFLSMTNVNVLNDKKMAIICLVRFFVLFISTYCFFSLWKANVCSMIGYYTPYLFIVKVAHLEHFVEKDDAVFLLSIIGNRNDLFDRIIERLVCYRF